MRRNKIYSLALSILVAFGLWLYVVTNISQEDDTTFYNIPIVMKGESVLNERNLMITGQSSQTVALHLSGTRSDLNKVNSGNITVEVDLSDQIEGPGERIPLSYTRISFPGDVANNALVVESRNPGTIYVDVDYRRTKEIEINVRYAGVRMEGYIYDTENAVLDNTMVTVTGPAAVVDQIAWAEIEVDLTDRSESVSESFRYTLCDDAGNPVDAEQVITNVEEVRLDMAIQKIKVLSLRVDPIYGGGATEENTKITIEPEVIRVSGGEAVLAELGDVYTLGTVNLADLEKSVNERSYTISLPEGVTNQTGVSEVTVWVRFSGLKTKDFIIDDISYVNLPEGLEAEIINAKMTVKVRGPAVQIDAMTEDDITAVVDLSNAEVGDATYRVSFSFGDEFPDVGALKTTSAPVSVRTAGE